MNPVSLIKKKRDGSELTEEEIKFLISGYVNGAIPDYQFSAFLMAVYFQGMSFAETTYLTKALIDSGKRFDLTEIRGRKIDKHSTGGVGDKVSLILAPLLAACGVFVPMVSGRALGHTGGTLDKLESIPGFRTNLSETEFVEQLKKIGVVMMGPTQELTPADKKIYALRDVTATVESIPLIAASIMSKKLAEGIDGLVLDVKTGCGAFLPKKSKAKELARVMVEIGKRANKRVTAFITDMSQPLGRTVGNSLEVEESIQTLQGKGEPDLMEIVHTLGSEMLILAEKAQNREMARKILNEAIISGRAKEKFRELITLQGGNPRVIDDRSLLPKAKYRVSVRSEKSGYVARLDTLKIGLLLNELGGGRKQLEEKIDHGVGFIIRKKIGDPVKEGEELVEVLANDESLAQEIRSCYQISSQRPKKPVLIIERICDLDFISQ